MEMQEIINQAEENIRQALRDYAAHTSKTEVLEDVRDPFIRQLAHDSSYAKQGLRELFSKSPVWDAKLDALVINGTRTHNPDYDRIYQLAYKILEKPLRSSEYDWGTLTNAISFFSNPEADETTKQLYIDSIRFGGWLRKPTRPRKSRAAFSRRSAWRWAWRMRPPAASSRDCTPSSRMN